MKLYLFNIYTGMSSWIGLEFLSCGNKGWHRSLFRLTYDWNETLIEIDIFFISFTIDIYCLIKPFKRTPDPAICPHCKSKAILIESKLRWETWHCIECDKERMYNLTINNM